MERKFEKPWQVMPARVIELGIKHAKKESDFDHQVGFLLLDIGVEAALKIFLIANKNEDLEFIRFPELIKKVQSEMNSRNISGIDLQDVSYFHGIRNKLYHQGDGVKPTTDNLQKYAELAKTIAEKLLNVDIVEIEEPKQPDKSAKDERFIFDERRKRKRSIQELTDELKKRFKCFHETCHFIAELKRPKLATRQVAAQIAHIRKSFIDEEEYVYDKSAGITSKKRAEILLYFAQERLNLFNNLVGLEFDDEDQDYVDFLLMDVNHLYAAVAISKISEEVDGNWRKYVDYVDLLAELPKKWEYSRKEDGEIYEEYNQVRVWTGKVQAELDAWLRQQVTDAVLPRDNYSLLFFQDLDL